jgi:hypothetical protein
VHSNPWAMRSPLLDSREGAKAMTMSLRDSVELISNPRHIDSSVKAVPAEIFGVPLYPRFSLSPRLAA